MSAVEDRLRRSAESSADAESALSGVVRSIDGYWSRLDALPPECGRLLRRLSRIVRTAAEPDDSAAAHSITVALEEHWLRTGGDDALHEALHLTLLEVSAFSMDIGEADPPTPREAVASLRELSARIDEYFRFRAMASRHNAELLRTSLLSVAAGLRTHE